MSKPPRNVCSHPRKNIRLVTLLTGAMRIVPAPPNKVQGISRREWLRVKMTVPDLYLTHRAHRPTAVR